MTAAQDRVTTAGDLLDAGQCSPQCLLAREAGPCICRCGGEYHGALVAATVIEETSWTGQRPPRANDRHPAASWVSRSSGGRQASDGSGLSNLGALNQDILAFVAERRGEVAAKDVADKFGQNAYTYLQRLTEAGHLDKLSRGRYCLAGMLKESLREPAEPRLGPAGPEDVSERPGPDWSAGPARRMCDVMWHTDEDGETNHTCPGEPVIDHPASPVALCGPHLADVVSAWRSLDRFRKWWRHEDAEDVILRIARRGLEGRGVAADVPALLSCVYGNCGSCNPLHHGAALTCHGCGAPLTARHGWFGDDVYVMRFAPDEGESHAPGCLGRSTGGPHNGAPVQPAFTSATQEDQL